MHIPVRQRWEEGDPVVHEGMSLLASITTESLEYLHPNLENDEDSPETPQDIIKFADLVSLNFDTRRKMFGDIALGSMNLMMIETMKKWGFSGKFSGSGGCVLSVWNGKSHKEFPKKSWKEKRWLNFIECKKELQKNGCAVTIVSAQEAYE
ncbi:hypothetical protein HK096_008960 [Nowakowskiella sp. JEL0078]|nr:hypothetical protein HK096_008960 [Nowakowskiella sp. JEL0078]